MRILMLSWEYPPRIVGGISRVVHDLAQKLAENGQEVHVITCWEPGSKEIEKDKYVYVHRVHTFDINTISFVDWVLQLNFALIEHGIKLISEFGKFDIIHAHDWLVAFAAKTMKNAFSIPLVATIHATEHGRNWGIHNETQKYISSVEWWLAYESWQIIVNSDYMKLEVQKVFQLPDNKVNIIPNGIDVNKFHNIEFDKVFRRKYALDEEKIIFFVGRMVNEKGVNILIDAIPKVLQHCYDTKFVIAGKGPQLDYFKWKVRNANISHKVHFTGYILEEDLMKLYKCVDVGVFPSLYEPFGIVVLEGMVAKLPVVVSDVGGFSDIVEHGVDGMKCYVGNANSLADNIIEVLTNEKKREEMTRNALEKAENQYNWSSITNKTINVYQSVIDETKTSKWNLPNVRELMKEFKVFGMEKNSGNLQNNNRKQQESSK